jgi:hypothetical protein
VSVYPPHLLDSQGRPTPAALIPFCAYSGDMRTTGEYINGLDFPVCSKFQPTVLDGALCYALNMNTVLPNGKKETTPGKGNGVLFAIDLGMSIEADDSKSNARMDQKWFLNTKNSQGKGISIHINTMSRISDSRPGTYVMNALKKMTGTDAFLALPDETKDCQIEPEDKCRTRRYIEEVQRQCGCVPWALNIALAEQVSRFGYVNPIYFQFENHCSSNASKCYTNIDMATLGCQASCTGLYADASYVEENLLDAKHKSDGNYQMFFKLEEDYKIYKNTYAKNFEFDPTKNKLSMSTSLNCNMLSQFQVVV